MSKADFATVKGDFVKALDTARSLAKYNSPIEARRTQLEEVGAAGVSTRLILDFPRLTISPA